MPCLDINFHVLGLAQNKLLRMGPDKHSVACQAMVGV